MAGAVVSISHTRNSADNIKARSQSGILLKRVKNNA